MRPGPVSATDRALAGALVIVMTLSCVQPIPTRPRAVPAVQLVPGEPVRPLPSTPAPPAPETTGAGPAPKPPAKDDAPACGPAPGDALDRWIAQASDALMYVGEAPITDRAALRLIIAAESSGDPCVVNTWDANAKRGTPSIGLVQTIRPTFDRWALPGYGDIRHPVDNIIAGTDVLAPASLVVRITIRTKGKLSKEVILPRWPTRVRLYKPYITRAIPESIMRNRKTVHTEAASFCIKVAGD